MKINYPVKYAAMPIIEQVGWSHGLHELEREYDVVCYIVSKCYLISDKTKYTADGRSLKEYEVVFPYHPGEFRRWNRVEPGYHLMDRHCVNSNIVERVFDTYEEADNYIKAKNEQLCENTWLYLSITKDIMERIQAKKDAFNEKLSIYKALEQEILLNTSDMEIGNTKQLNDVIKIENNKPRILDCNIYEVLNLFDDKKFVVYSISQEQYNNLVKMIDENQKKEINSIIVNAQGLMVHKSKEDVIKLATPEECGAYYIKGNTIKYDSKSTKVTKDDFENVDTDTLIFYTTETLDDLLISFNEITVINLNELEGMVLKRVKNH